MPATFPDTSTAQEEHMEKVAEYRAQELLCRVRASFDQQHQQHWLKEAEEWRRRAQQEVTFHFRECNTEQTGIAPVTTEIDTQARV
jgi:hypothetical protein